MISDRHLLTDEKLLNSMKAAAAIRNFMAFDQLEDALWQRYIEFDIETFEIPFNRDKMIQQFPENIRQRYVDIRKQMYPFA